MFLETAMSNVFGGANAKLESTLKNPNQYRDAVLYESLSGLSSDRIKEFVKSPEAKTMLNEGLISQEVLERLANKGEHHILKTTVCHMAKENGDPIWDEFIKAHIQERRLMNELIEKYADQAKPIADNAKTDFVEACIPEYFRK